MYDLNQPDEILSISPDVEATGLSPAAEFRLLLDSVTPESFVTYILIALNALAFLATLLNGMDPIHPATISVINNGANYGPKTIGGEWWRLVSSMFLHIGVMHIAFNMFVLYKAGPFVERLFGNFGFLVLYMVSGVGGSLLSLAWHPYLASAGASGAIFGVYGALLGFLVLRNDTIPSEVLDPLAKSALAFVVYNLVFGLILPGNIDVACHVGGLATGFLCGLCLSTPLTAYPRPNRAPRAAVLAAGSAVLFIGVTGLFAHPVDLHDQIQKLSVVEKKTLSAYNGAVTQAHKTHQRDEQLADIIDKDVLPDWSAERRKLQALTGLPEQQQLIMSKIVRYMDAREQAWTLMARGLRAHDIAMVTQANAKQRSAVQIMQEIANPQMSRFRPFP